MLLLSFIALHVAVAVLMPPLVHRFGSHAFFVAALPPALSVGWVLSHGAGIVAGNPLVSTVEWVPELGISLDFRVDSLALAMVLLVSGIGAVIFGYGAGYFPTRPARGPLDPHRKLGTMAAILVLFAAAMLGLVTTDNLLALYVFWELTSVTSFLLIGYDDHAENSRRAATQALVTTAGFGLPMLLGFILLAQIGGTYRISELVAEPPLHSSLLPLALVLILAGAFAKSAQAPLHYWLPTAMVAPTPVSAYLHAAAMVKAGVYLLARLAPGFAEVDPWRALVIVFGLATMLVGAWHALRQDDLKLLLAYGTVSQLGLLTVLAGMGTHVAAVATIGLLLAHGFFKAALFLVVGVIDHQTGTRDIRRLSGLGRRMPVLAAVAGFAAASMAGLPPFLGFVAKETALEAFLSLPGDAGALTPATGTIVAVVLALGSALTVAYSLRFLWGAFARRDTGSGHAAPRPSASFLTAPTLLALLGAALGAAPFLVDPLAQGYAAGVGPTTDTYHLALWHGPTTALALSALAWGLGALLFWWRGRERRPVMGTSIAEAGYFLVIHGIYRTALGVTRRLQSGSLRLYLGIILGTLLVLPGAHLGWALVAGEVATPTPGNGLRLWDSLLELVIATLIVVTAVATAREWRRFPALILISAMGFGVTGLFALHAAPDLALTLLLVETLSTIVLVFVLRRLPATFEDRVGSWLNGATIALCVAAGTFVAAMLWLATYARVAEPVSRGYTPLAEDAGGRNLVNVILADFRALDTFGEIVVLATAAVAVASLVLMNRGERVGEAVRSMPRSKAGGEDAAW